ncbi:MAG: hypothetical protein Alpg2KO_17860 [Alphaproteobacteria bacterium]
MKLTDRVAKFFKGAYKDTSAELNESLESAPKMTVFLGGVGVVATLVNPLTPVAVANYLVLRNAQRKEHEQLMQDIRDAHSTGQNLDQFRTDLSSFKPGRVKEYYSRGTKNEKEDRKVHSAALGGTGVLDVLGTGGIGLAIGGVNAYMEARERNKLIDRLQGNGPRM